MKCTHPLIWIFVLSPLFFAASANAAPDAGLLQQKMMAGLKVVDAFTTDFEVDTLTVTMEPDSIVLSGGATLVGVACEISAQFSSDGEEIEELHIEFPKENSAGFEKISRLVGDNVKQHLPEGLITQQVIRLSKVIAQFEPDPKGTGRTKLHSLEVAIGFGSAYEVIRGIISIGNVVVSVKVTEPEPNQKPRLGFSLAGSAEFKEAVEITVSGGLGKDTAKKIWWDEKDGEEMSEDENQRFKDAKGKPGTAASSGAVAAAALGQKPPSFKDEWWVQLESNELNLGQLLKLLDDKEKTFTSLPIPPEIREIGLESTFIRIFPKLGMLMGGAESPVGNVVVDLNTKPTLTRSVIFEPKAGFRFASLGPVLSPLDALNLHRSALVVADSKQSLTARRIKALPNGAVAARGVSIMADIAPQQLSPDLGKLFGDSSLILSATIGIGSPSLELKGVINVSVPFDQQQTVVFKNPEIFLAMNPPNNRFGLAGNLHVKVDQQLLEFKGGGEMGLGAAGTELRLSGIMNGTLDEPLGIRHLQLKDLGLGMGVNLARPVPLPSIAFKGKLVAGNPANPAFSGDVLLGVDTATPSNSVIDAAIGQLSVQQIMDGMLPMVRIPPSFANTLKTASLKNARLTFAPLDITLLDVPYEKGLLVQGQANIANMQGLLMLEVGTSGIEGHAAISSIRHPPMFTFTGARGQGDPYLSLSVKPMDADLSLSGHIDVLGISQDTELVFNDTGFAGFVQGKAFNAFQASVDVAGGDIKNGGTIYAHARFKDDLFNRIDTRAADVIEKAARKTSDDMQRAQADIARSKNEINRLDLLIADKKEAVKKRREANCNKLRTASQTATRERNKLDNLKQQISAKRKEIKNLETLINESKSCPAGQFDGLNEYCYSCPSGFKREGLSTNCVKTVAGDKVKASFVYKQTPPLGCRSGTFANIGSWDCHRCPPGYKHDLKKRVEVKGVCYKDDKITRRSATRGARIAGVGMNADLVSKQAELSSLKAARKTSDAALKAASDIVDGLAKACDVVPLEADPEVAVLITSKEAAKTALDAANIAVEVAKRVGLGTLNAVNWIARHGGKAAGIVKIRRASFEGCLSAAHGGKLDLRLQGTFADQPIDGHVAFNMKNPVQSIDHFARVLLNRNGLARLAGGSTCRKPAIRHPGSLTVNDHSQSLRKQATDTYISQPRPGVDPAVAPAAQPSPQPARKPKTEMEEFEEFKRQQMLEFEAFKRQRMQQNSGTMD